MQAVETLTAERILAIPDADPELLFGADPSAVRTLYRTLAKRWHPNAYEGADAEAVFEKIARLAEAARKRAEAGDWRTPGLLHLATTSGKAFEIRYRRRREFELGEVYVSPTVVAYALRNEVADLAANAAATVAALRKGLEDSGPEAVAMFGGRLPTLKADLATAERRVLVFAKTPDQFLLGDLVSWAGGRLDPRHVAWIVSDLEATLSLVETRPRAVPGARAFVNPAIGFDTVLVSAKNHTAAPVGGWWYAAPAGTRLPAAPERTHGAVAPILLADGRASMRIPLDLVRLTALEALGHRGPTAALRDPGVPPAFARWLASSPAADAVADYAGWEKARDAAFPRRFVEFAVDPDRVYPPVRA